VLWHVELGRSLPRPRCYPVLAGGHLCLPTGDGAVVGLALEGGTPTWEYRLPDSSAAYTLATNGALVFVGPYDTQAVPRAGRKLVALNGATGEVVWTFDARTHSYSGPVCDGMTVYVTTADGQIHALDAATGVRRWSEPHPDWAPPAPVVGGGVLVTGGRGPLLIAYDAAAGHELWRFTGGGWFAARPTIVAGLVLAFCWDGFLYALDLAEGHLRWKTKGERSQGFSSPPAPGPGLVLLGDRVAGAPKGGYAIRALRARDGVELWRFATPRYVSALAAVDGTLALCPCEDNQLYALDADDGAVRWTLTLAEDPTTMPVVHDDIAYVADHAGGVYAVRVRPSRPLSATPDELLALGDVEGAARAFVLSGDPIAGAMLYGRRLGKPREAALIYEHIDLPGQAAPYWEQAGELLRAREAFQSAGDLLGLASYLARTGELLEAGRAYEELGRLSQAAELYEQAGDKVRAAELYAKAGERQRASRVASSQDPWEQQAERLIASGALAEAAALLNDHGQLERAAVLYEQAGMLADALLLRLDLQHWAKVADLAQAVGDLEHTAVAFERLGERQRAAEVYEQAAQQSLAVAGADLRFVAGLYEQAARLFAEAFDPERAATCQREVGRHRRLPELQVALKVEQDFIEQEWNTATIELKNVGFGPARGIQVREPERFELDGSTVLAGVAPEREARLTISLRSRPGEVGQRVPLDLTVAFLDSQDQPYEVKAPTFVRVLPKGMEPARVTPLPTPVATLRPQGDHLAPSEVPLTLRFELEHDATAITWEADVIGVRQSRLVSPYRGDDLDLIVRALDLLQYPSATLDPEELARIVDLGLPVVGGSLSEAGHRAVGRALYKALVADPRGAEALSTVRNYARAEGRPLALRLRFPPEAIELAALPWELLWDDGPAPLLLGGGKLAGCTRHLDLAEAVPPPRPREGPLRILAITPHAGIDAEARERERAERTAAWAPLIASGEVVMEELTPATRRVISERMLSGPCPDIVHFVGHGHYADGEGLLILDKPDGGWDKVPASRLMPLFGEVRLVVLCACQGAMSGEGGLLTGVAPALSAAGVPAVVAMQLTVRAAAATRFSEVMYRTLARGESLQRAVIQARQALFVEEQEGASWYVPTVTIRARDPGPLFLFGR
jgi:outer membrane protein assembly factor BamB